MLLDQVNVVPDRLAVGVKFKAVPPQIAVDEGKFVNCGRGLTYAVT
jgi:hypothetical protein